MVMQTLVSSEKSSEKRTTFDLPIGLVEEFNAFVKDNGYLQKRAAAAALKLFQWAPIELRKLLMADDERGARAWLQTARVQALQAQLNEELQKLQELSEQRPGSRRRAGGGSGQ